VGQDEALRQRLGEIAVRAARAVDYVNAGTVEFLMDRDRNFYFLEMNTRIQVEHPVTELVTGVDIVKEQIRIARGRALRYSQQDIRMQGWAIEARINAEDPYNNFLPSLGKVLYHSPPTGPGVRVDTGVFTGMEITPYYDPLIAKLIVWGESRAQAILRMRRALDEYKILGVKTNIPFHQKMLTQYRPIKRPNGPRKSSVGMPGRASPCGNGIPVSARLSEPMRAPFFAPSPSSAERGMERRAPWPRFLNRPWSYPWPPG